MSGSEGIKKFLGHHRHQTPPLSEEKRVEEKTPPLDQTAPKGLISFHDLVAGQDRLLPTPAKPSERNGSKETKSPPLPPLKRMPHDIIASFRAYLNKHSRDTKHPLLREDNRKLGGVCVALSSIWSYQIYQGHHDGVGRNYVEAFNRHLAKLILRGQNSKSQDKMEHLINDLMLLHSGHDYFPLLIKTHRPLDSDPDIVCESDFVATFTVDKLTQHLDRLLPKHRMVMMSVFKHTMAIWRTDDTFILYDANHPGGEIQLDITNFRTSATFLFQYINEKYGDGIPRNQNSPRIIQFATYCRRGEATEQDAIQSMWTSEMLQSEIVSERTPLQGAVASGSISLTRQLIQIAIKSEIAMINKADKMGVTPLHMAASYGRADIVKLLLENEADVNQPDRIGSTPLYHAAYHGRADVVKLLLENKAYVNQPDRIGWTPLLIAASSGHIDIVRQLLENGADVNQSDSNGSTPLYHAAYHGHTDVVKLLLKNGAVIDQADFDNMTPLYIAAYYGRADIVKLLLKNGADVNQPNRSGLTPLHVAASSGHIDIVRQLLENGADVNQVDTVDITPPLHIAIQGGSIDIVALLLMHKADVNQPDRIGRTPLHVAASSGHIDIVRQLLMHKADVNQVNGNGKTPIYAAGSSDHWDIVRLLSAAAAE